MKAKGLDGGRLCKFSSLVQKARHGLEFDFKRVLPVLKKSQRVLFRTFQGPLDQRRPVSCSLA